MPACETLNVTIDVPDLCGLFGEVKKLQRELWE